MLLVPPNYCPRMNTSNAVLYNITAVMMMKSVVSVMEVLHAVKRMETLYAAESLASYQAIGM